MLRLQKTIIGVAPATAKRKSGPLAAAIIHLVTPIPTERASGVRPIA
jgi:hypothetical protein